MKIAISLLSGIAYGGATYFHNLIPALAAYDSINEYHLFVPKAHSLIETVQQKNIFFHECSAHNSSALKRFLWEQFVFPLYLKRYNIDVLFTAKNLNVFFALCRTVIAIRNLEPLRYREYVNDWKLNVMSWIKLQLTKWSMRKADAIVAVSSAVKEYVQHRFPWTKDKVKVIYNGNPIRIVPAKSHESSSYLLTASKFVAYANQLNLIRAYAILRKRRADTPPLWLGGGIHDQKYFANVKKCVQENEIEEYVKFLGLIPHDRLLEIMRTSFAFIFPSTLESCPHTLIEAMACGVPIATSTVQPMPEICADAALYFDPHEPDDMADTIEQVLSDVEVRTHLAQVGTLRVQFFTWEKTARDLLNVFML